MDLQAKIPMVYIFLNLNTLRTPEPLGIQEQALLYLKKKSATLEAWLLGRSFEFLTDSTKS